MASYSGRGDFSGTAYKAGGDTFTLNRYSSAVPNYSQNQSITTGRYNINDCKVNVSYSAGSYWGDSNLASGYSHQSHQGWSSSPISTGNTRGDGLANLSQGGWIWCNGWSTTSGSTGGGNFDVSLSTSNNKTIYFNFGTRRSAPFVEGNGAHPSWVITIVFEKCPKRFELKNPSLSVRSATQIKGSVSYEGYGITPSRIDSRLQKVQSTYSYGNDVIGGWHGDGDHSAFDYTNLSANTQYELHSFVVNGDFNDTANNGNQEGNTVRTTRHWTLPIVGTATLAVSMASSTSFKWTATATGSWTTTSKYFRIRYKQKGSTGDWTTKSFTTDTSGTITGLTAGKKYEVQLQPRAHGGGGDNVDGTWTGSKEVQLGILWTMTGITCTTREKTALKGFSSTSKDGVPGITNYQFRIRKNGTTTWTESSSLTSNSWNATSLSTNTKYDVQARVKNAVGWSSWSSTYNFCTKSSAGTASATCVRNRDLGKLNIKVNTGGTYSPEANTYQIRYRKKGTANWTEVTASTNQTQTLSNLTQAQEYDIQVRARTKTGVDGSSTDWSAWSSTYNVKTVKTVVQNDVEFMSNTTSSVTVKVSYTENYPNATRIYYALARPTDTPPNRVSGMYVTTSSSPKTFTISKDASNKNLVTNEAYILYTWVNQYKSTTDWYTAGLDLYSNKLQTFVATKANVGTISNVKCIKNNDYKSLTIHAEKSGTWSVYAGWQYRYKISTADNSKYTVWSDATTGDKIITGLTAGETYTIQVRGTTGMAQDTVQYYTDVTTLTIKVVKRPTIELSINSITTDKVKIVAKVIDKGYPELNSILWNYASNSYITSSYVPGTYVQQKLTSSVATTNIYEFTLYKQAMYNFKIQGRQYKSGADWYTAGIDNKTDFELKNVELSLYSSRTDRLKTNKNGFKQIDKFYHYADNKWNYDGQKTDNKNSTNMVQFAYCKDFDKINSHLDWFGDSTSTSAHNSYVKENYKTYIPMFDNTRKDISTAYGGNLLPYKLNIDFTNLDIGNETSNASISIDSRYNYKISKNAISLKLKNDISLTNYIGMLRICKLYDLVDFNSIDYMYVEYNVNIIPAPGDTNKAGGVYTDYNNYASPSSHLGEIISKCASNSTNGTRYLICIPIVISKEYENRESYLHKFAGSIRFNAHEGTAWCFNMKKANSIINFSNFGFYYLPKNR